MSSELRIWAPAGVPELGADGDVAGALVTALAADGDPSHLLADGDVVAVTSKVVSKAEGRVRRAEREAAVDSETVRVVAAKGPTRIVRTRHGLTLAAAGVDASNVARGLVVLLPEDPDASARRLRGELGRAAGANVAVIVTDTAGRAWREGQTDLAIGVAGLEPLHSFAGRTDAHGNALVVTAPAVADEIAGAAELVQTKLGGRPFAIVRGLGHLVLGEGEDGPGAQALVRAEDQDLFGYGAREAVIRALSGKALDRGPFGRPAGAEEMRAALVRVLGAEAEVGESDSGLRIAPGPEPAQIGALAFAHGWTTVHGGPHGYLIRPATP